MSHNRNIHNRNMGCFTNKKMLLLILHIQILLIASQDFVPLVLGPDFQRAYDDKDILRGFKLNVQEGENPLKGHAFEGGVDSSPFSNSYTKSAVITSVDDLKEMMEIKGSLSVSYGPMISGSGAGSYLDKKVKSKRQVSILYRTRRVAYAKKVDVKTLQPVAGLDQLEPDEITERYGTKFIDQILYGAQLDVIFTVEASEDTDFFEIEAELKGKIGFGPLSIEFEANFEKQEGSTESRYTMGIEARASGIAFAVPSNPSFNQVNELIDNFNRKYEEMLAEVGEGETVDVSNVAKQFSPVAFALSPIASYLPSKLSIEESARFDDKMGALRDVFHHALFSKSQLGKIRAEQERLYGTDPRVSIEIFQPYNDEVNVALRELEKNIDECLAYRKMPMRTILEPTTKTPNKYADSAAEVKILNGLVGEAYIPSPVTINGMAFEEFHYIGFAIPSSNSARQIVPWMGGVLRRDNDNSIVASAQTPDLLAEMGLAEISAGKGHKYLKYGDAIFLQVASLDYRWLKRGNSTSNAMTRDYFPEVGQSAKADYQWHVRSMVVGNIVSSDPKQGQCVRYGDILFLNSNHGEWLHREYPYKCSVANFEDGSCVNTVAKDFQTAHLQWKVRSTMGSGALEADINPDPAHGQCIQLLSKVYLQSNNDENWWLTGGRSTGHESVLALDSYRTKGQIGAFSAKENKCMASFAGSHLPGALGGFYETRKMDACQPVFMSDCQDNDQAQVMEYDDKTLQIKHNGYCLDYYNGDSLGCADVVTMRACRDPARSQECLRVTRTPRINECGGESIQTKFTSNLAFIYNDRGSGADNDFAAWRPQGSSIDGWYSLGDVGFSSYGSAFGDGLLVKAPGDILMPPLDYNLIWKDSGSGGDMDGSFWEPIPRTGYTCLGHVAQPNYGKPSTDLIRCIKTRYVVDADKSWLWTDAGSGADWDASVYQVVAKQPDSLGPNTFITRRSHAAPAAHHFKALNTNCIDEGNKDDAYVDVFVDSGSGYVTVSTPGKPDAASEVVVDQCFEKILGIQVKNDNNIAWTGTIELSTDGKVTYSPFTCSSCTGITMTMPIAVDGYGGSNDLTTTRCPYGVACSLTHESLTLNNQRWQFDRNTMELKSALDGKCLNSGSNGELHMQECFGEANQKFIFIDEQSRHQNYEWIVLKEVGDGLRDDGFFCPADAATGSWKPAETIDGTYHEIGIDRSIEFPYWEQNSSWEDSVTASVTSGFQFGNSDRGTKIPWIDAKEMETSVRDVLHDLDFMDDGDMKSGQAWQFVYEISDACEPMWELRTEDIVVTSDADQEPCCLPGQELNSNQPHGPCKYQSACQCGDSVCYPSGDAESAPTIAPTRTSIPPRNAPASTEDSNFADKPTLYQAWIAIIVAAIVHYSGWY
mmetsp:Transcript_2965/g.6510  ORF Transcript_2965/g.6510 Transcript_2965/m.6510 type:complete len:1386 (+) Transcript_2965:77-4234(+)